MTLKLTIFIIMVVFIIGSLVLALWYRVNEDQDE
tara:strand:+ start:376 stop:477 length:102 start_codon:yes stop_codon:yes gene_type:complete